MRVLLAEDDAASRAFLVRALEGLGCEVEAGVDGNDALARARQRRFDLLLFDRNLPGLGAFALLDALRADDGAASRNAAAIACSAEWDPASRATARAAGFAATLDKPCDVSRLRQALDAAAPPGTAVLRDDEAALGATGTAGNLVALRRLFAGELQQWEESMSAGSITAAEWPERLHRLIASAGFCGAPALGAAGRILLQRLRSGVDTRTEMHDFVTVLHATRARFDDP
jgi:CheY-like chemotaxis protein